MRQQTRRWLIAALAVLVIPASASAKKAECNHDPVITGKLSLYQICHCETYDYAALTEKLKADGVRIARKQAVWKNEKGLAKCSVNLGWSDLKNRRVKARCNDKNINRIIMETLQTEPYLAVNSASLKCE